MYQKSTDRLAPVRRDTASRRVMRDAVISDFALVAGALLIDGMPLNDADRQFLWDITRNDPRYQFATVARLIEIASRATRDEHAEMLSTRVRLRIVARRPRATDIGTTLDEETDAQAEADRATMAFLRNPCETTRERARMALHRHGVKLGSALAALA